MMGEKNPFQQIPPREGGRPTEKTVGKRPGVARRQTRERSTSTRNEGGLGRKWRELETTAHRKKVDEPGGEENRPKNGRSVLDDLKTRFDSKPSGCLKRLPVAPKKQGLKKK